jgi:hypothetical protein
MSFVKIVLTLIIGLPLAANLCLAQTVKVTRKCETAETVLTYLRLHKKHPPSYPLSRKIGLINRNGYCGPASEDDLNKIQQAGGSPDLIRLIKEKTSEASPVVVGQPTEPKPQIRTGSLQVVCEPVDCQVFMNGTDLGTSTKGEFSATLPVGLVTVTATKENYDVEPKTYNAEIKENEPVKLSFTLGVARAALEKTGSRLFAQMIQALGGEKGLTSLGSFKASGTIYCYGTGRQGVWDFSVLQKSPDKVRFALTRSNSKSTYEATITERGLEWKKTERTAEFKDLDLSLRRFQEQQIARGVEALQNTGFKMVAEGLQTETGGATVFRAEGGGRDYRITLDADMRPLEILFEGEGFDKGLKVMYSQYENRDGAVYPMQTEIQYPGGSQFGGVSVKLRSIALNPAGVTDADFDLKKKLKF